MKIIVLDNYDSFTYNLVCLIKRIGIEDIEVHFNDKISTKSIEKYDKIILSPGPGLPKNSGIMMDLIDKFHDKKSILGVCLGHQALGEYFGMELENMKRVKHGISSEIEILDSSNLFKNVPKKIRVGHYHSWVLNGEKISEDIEILALDRENMVMAIKHKKYSIYGVQFHPESVLTEYGNQILSNWLDN